MSAFTFRLAPPDRDPVERIRQLEDAGQALAFARQMLQDWPDCESVDVFSDGKLFERLRRIAA